MNIKELIKSLPKFWFLRLLIYPITGLITTPIQLIKTLYNSKVLIKGQWTKYSHFNPIMVIINFFYWKVADEILNNGISNQTNTLGKKNFELSAFNHYGLLPFYSYRFAGSITLIIGMLIMLLSHFIWLTQLKDLDVILPVILLGSSTLLYSLCFSRQNYNIIGWSLFPILLFMLNIKFYIISIILLLILSFLSITTVTLGVMFYSLTLIVNQDYYYLILLFLIVIKYIISWGWSDIIKDLKKILFTVSRSKSAKYKRNHKAEEYLAFGYYFLAYIFFLFSYWYINNTTSLFVILGASILIVNSFIFRFADYESMFTLMLLVITYAIITNFSYFLLIPYWLVISPLPIFAGYYDYKNIFDIVPVHKPIDSSSLSSKMDIFISGVPSSSTILMLFENPKNNYHLAFKGLNYQKELISYISTKNNILFMPDYFTLFSFNKKDDPEFWGTDIKNATENIQKFEANYIIIPLNKNETISNEWILAGFELISKFSWLEFKNMFEEVNRIDITYKSEWYLLKVPEKYFNN